MTSSFRSVASWRMRSLKNPSRSLPQMLQLLQQGALAIEASFFARVQRLICSSGL